MAAKKESPQKENTTEKVKKVVSPKKDTKIRSSKATSVQKPKVSNETTKKTSKSSSKETPNNILPAINIGLVGHVDHGKTTLTECLSGKWTDTHSEEIKRGITIRLGYANTDIYYCDVCKKYSVHKECDTCGGEAKFVRRLSLVDAPGHESLMATMLAGATVMDAAILMVSANEHCPQPQTKEHLIALQIAGIKNIIIVQNKIDLVSEEQAIENYNEIRKFIKATPFANVPIVPISAIFKVNIDTLLETIEDRFKTPVRDSESKLIMYTTRTFDINKPGSDINTLKGGVIGGAIVQGKIIDGDEIQIAPGHKVERNGRVSWVPITTKVKKIMTGNSPIKEAIPGGSIALLTELDPSIVKSDNLSGAVVAHKGDLPPVWNDLKLKVKLLKRIVGAKENISVDSVKMKEILMLNSNSAATVGIVSKVSKNGVECGLKLPICAQVGDRVTISRRIGSRFRLIGYGIIEE